MKVDSHHHLWTYAGHEADYVWMTDDLANLRRDFSMADLQPLLAGSGYAGTVVVQAREMAAETSFLLAAADAHPQIMGVVGWLDLYAPDVERQIEHYAAHPKLKGLRMLIHDRPDPDFAISDAHVAGVSKLAKHGLRYDLLLKPPHLAAATKLADRLPDQMFVVDHIAKPDIRNHVFEPWRREITEIARRPNVHCKLSSVITQADWRRWKPADIFPYLDIVLDAFGPDRIMVGSDWPVSTLAADYGTTMGLFEAWAARLSASERAKFLGGNCCRFYALEERS